MFLYDAYGQLLAIFNDMGVTTHGGNGIYADATAALTNVLYSGEQFDTRIGQQYLRARYSCQSKDTMQCTRCKAIVAFEPRSLP